MGTIIRLLLTRLLPARLTWIVAAFVLARALAAREPARDMPRAQTTSGRGRRKVTGRGKA